MCGIAGFWHPGRPPADVAGQLQQMLATQSHRGPDGSGLLVDGPVALGHVRLSVIDLVGGAQPMTNEDGSVHVVFNGEVFNYRALRDELRTRGHRFRSASDTEVLVHAYEEWGDGFVEQLNGQFAFALWDAPRRRLLLVRDRAGIRPLYYTWVGGRLAFASEIKALFSLSDVPRRFDPNGIAAVFSLWAPVAPSTVFEGVSCVPPGHTMVVDDEGARCAPYWDWPYGDEGALSFSEERIANELRELLIDATRLQLQSDVPVATYLSGGLDSSAITSLVVRHGDTPVRAFSLTFDDAEFDESAHQLTMARHLGIEHHPVHCTAAHIGAAFPRAIRHAESPLVRTAAVPMMLLADAVHAAGYKVVLTGEGADEVFAGYDLFKEARIRRFLAGAPHSRCRPAILQRLYPYLAHSPGRGPQLARQFFGTESQDTGAPWYAHLTRIQATSRSWALLSEEVRGESRHFSPRQVIADLLPAQARNWSPLARAQYVEAKSMMANYLLSSQGDRMAMAASVEARFPFLDHRVMEFGARLPSKLKLRGLRDKRILRQALRGDLPEPIRQRPKQPYRAPDSGSFFPGGKALEYVREALSPRRLADAGLFQPALVSRLSEKCRLGKAIGFADNMAFVGVLSTMLVHAQMIRREAAV